MPVEQCLSLGVFLLIAFIGCASAIGPATARRPHEAHINQTTEDLKSHGNPNVSLVNGCDCINQVCGCCISLDISLVDLHETACVNVSYLPDQYGISLMFILGGDVLINETVSAKNPPPICIDIPDLKQLLSVCIDFYNLNINGDTFEGCIKLEAKALFVWKVDYDIGCFNMGTKKKKMGPNYNLKDQQQWLEQLAVMQTKKRMQMEMALMQNRKRMQRKTLL